MIYIDGVGYVDERSYNASKKLNFSNQKQSFDSVLEKETIIYATPETSASFTEAGSLKVTAPSELEQYFQDAANAYGMDVNLLKAVAKQESDFNTNAVSSSGAVGIMQLMPQTAAGLGVTNAYDAKENIYGGAKYLSNLLNHYHQDVSLALAAYNAGPGNVDKYNGIPPFTETQNYVSNVLAYMGQNLSISNTAATVYSVASKDITSTAKQYTIYAQPKTV